MALPALFLSALLGIAGPAAAFDLSTVETREILGLVGPSQPERISNQILGDLPLATQGIESLKGRNLRTRYWLIEGNGGIVPNHGHANRPAAFIVLSGETFEYRSDVDGRLKHETGGIALEQGEIAHWWLNEGAEDVRLIAFDVWPAMPDPDRVEATPALPLPAIALPPSRDAMVAFQGAVDLGVHFDSAYGDGLVLALYKAEIAPGGLLAQFSAPGAPLQTFVWQGSVSENRTDISDPVLLARESGSTVPGNVLASWSNPGDTPAVMYFGVVEAASAIEGLTPQAPRAH